MKATCVRSRPQRGEEDHSHSQDKGREWEADSWEADTQLQTEAGIWLMTRAWCAQALIHDISMERRSINANPAPSQSHREKLWPCQKKVASTPDPRLSFSTNPSVRPALLHPSLPVSTAFAFSSRIKPLSLSPLRPFPLLSLPMSRYLMFLSPLLIPNLHPIQAGCFHWGANVRKDKLWSPHKHCVLFESFCLRADFSSRKKQGRLEWRGRGCEKAAGWAGDMLTDAPRFRTCRGSCSWEAEVKRGKGIWSSASRLGNTFIALSSFFEDDILKLLFLSLPVLRPKP